MGDNTQAKKCLGAGASRRACSIGRVKAPVFPEPVCASPITSFPTKKYSYRHISTINIYQAILRIPMGVGI